MVDRHYSLNLKPWSARTPYVYAHADLAQKYSVGLQEIFVSRLCSQEENYFSCPVCQTHAEDLRRIALKMHPGLNCIIIVHYCMIPYLGLVQSQSITL
jgi:hypothetical protein